ncbi:MAG TPA: hypothetical protein VM431_00740 [Phycisphaerae bacterium]|nr:hypothetical protein [Phycisphaerae bacterium]
MTINRIGAKLVLAVVGVLAVADAFDALTSPRPYRAAADVPETLRTLIEESGRQFDAKVVDGVMGWVRATGRQLGRPGDVTTDDVLSRGAQTVMSE